MRKVALVRSPEGEVRRLVLASGAHAGAKGAWLFLCRQTEDVGAFADEWHPSLEEAEIACEAVYGVQREDWLQVPDALPGCRRDWLAPVRVKGSETDTPEWGELERLEDGRWVPLEPGLATAGSRG